MIFVPKKKSAVATKTAATMVRKTAKNSLAGDWVDILSALIMQK
jgi:hypothetical protein